MGIIRAFERLLGLLCVAVAALLGLVALGGYFVENTSGSYAPLAVIGGLAVLLLVIGLRWLHGGAGAERRVWVAASEPYKAEYAAVLAKWPEFANLRFGDRPPTVRQFVYAVALGVKLKNGVTIDSISDLIDEAKAVANRPKKADRPSREEAEIIYYALLDKLDREPAPASLLKIIKDYHGVLPRRVSRGEAKRIIEFLEDYTLPCPFCRTEIFATDDECLACGKSLRKMRIPIQL